MSTCTCQTAPLVRPVIGRWVLVLHKDRFTIGTVLDRVAGTEKPKRVRIQRGPLQGEVIQPQEYLFKSFLEETEIDP